jgi:FixJ family two-component response regulator
MSGMELHRLVADLDERQAERVVFTTGGAFTAGGREFLDRTPHARIEKPFEVRELRAVVERFEIGDRANA